MTRRTLSASRSISDNELLVALPVAGLRELVSLPQGLHSMEENRRSDFPWREGRRMW